MLGLWGPITTYGSDFHKAHLAFAVSREELLTAGERLRTSGVLCEDFNGSGRTNRQLLVGCRPRSCISQIPMDTLSSSSPYWIASQIRAYRIALSVAEET